MKTYGNLPFGFDRPEDSLGFLLWQTTMVWQRQIKKALEPYDISHAQFVVMATILWFEAHEYDITQVLIINQTKLDKMTVSKSLKKLVSNDYASRIEHKTDARAKSVTLTEKGKEAVYKLVPIIEGIDCAFFDRAAADEQEILKRILRKLVKNDKSE